MDQNEMDQNDILKSVIRNGPKQHKKESPEMDQNDI